MNQQTTPEIALIVPVPAGGPERPLEKILAASAEAFKAIHEHQRDRQNVERIKNSIAYAETFMAEVATVADTLRQAVEPVDLDTIARQIRMLITAWPNTPDADLTGYDAQLVDDVMGRHPCRYALREGLRHVRQTSKTLPSIAEVLAALDAAQRRIRNTAWHVGQIPAELDKARADLAKAEAFEAERAAYRARTNAGQAIAGGHREFLPGAVIDDRTGEPS